MQDRNDRPKISKNQKSKNESILVKIQWKLEKKWKLKAGKTSTYLRRQKKKGYTIWSTARNDRNYEAFLAAKTFKEEHEVRGDSLTITKTVFRTLSAIV